MTPTEIMAAFWLAIAIIGFGACIVARQVTR